MPFLVDMNSRRILSSLFCLLVGSLLAWNATLVAAQQITDDLIVTINQVDDTSYPHVQVIASVTDQEGNPIEGLTDADFSLLQEGRQVEPIETTSATGSQLGIAIVMVIDTSGSMNQADSSGLTALNEAKVAANSFINGLNLTLDQVAIISFNSSIVRTHPFSSDIDALEQAIEGLTADGETRLYDATYEAAELITALPPGRKAIIVLSDGQDTESRLTVDDVKNRAGENNVPIFTIGLGPEADQFPLERLATLTGGRYLEAPTAADIVTIFETIADQLRKQYVLTFESDIPANDLRHTLNLNVSSEERSGEDASSYVARARPGEVLISTPDNGEEVTGQIVISPTLQMPGKVAQVSLLVDSELQETVSEPPFTFTWDASQVEAGDHTLLITVSDHVGNRAEASTKVSVVPADSTQLADVEPSDTREPELEATIINLQDGDELSEPTPVVVEVTEALHGVKNVEFWVNDELLDSLQLEPYETMWDVTDFEPGEYTVSALVYDNEGNQFEYNVRAIVSPPPVLLATLDNLNSGETISEATGLAVTINRSDYGVKRVEFLVDGAIFAREYTPPYETTWDINGLEQGEHIVSARVYDNRGNLWEDSIEVTVIPPSINWPLPVIFIVGGLFIVILGVLLTTYVVRRRRPVPDYSRRRVPAASTKAYPIANVGTDDTLTTEISEAGTSELTSRSMEASNEQSTTEIRESAATDTSTIINDADVEEDESAIGHPAPSPTWFDQVVSDQPSLPKAYLIGAHGPSGQIQEYPLFERDVTIGRSQDVDIMLLDAKVSRYHAKILYENGEFVFQDTQPTNPTHINGHAYSNPHIIKDGDELIIGRVKLIFRRAD